MHRARALYQESLALLWGVGHKRGIAECLEALAKIARAQGQHKRAARVYGAAEALREAIGVHYCPPNAPSATALSQLHAVHGKPKMDSKRPRNTSILVMMWYPHPGHQAHVGARRRVDGQIEAHF
jgi:hypothetical protein